MNRFVTILCASLALSALSACTSPRAISRVNFDEDKSTPRELLSYLTQLHRKPNTFTFDDKRPCWITEADVSYFITRLDSTSPASSVRLPPASFIRDGSTEGDEAGYLIKGFRLGIYPPDLGSDPLSGEAKQEIRDWWQNYRSGRAPLEGAARTCVSTP